MCVGWCKQAVAELSSTPLLTSVSFDEWPSSRDDLRTHSSPEFKIYHCLTMDNSPVVVELVSSEEEEDELVMRPVLLGKRSHVIISSSSSSEEERDEVIDNNLVAKTGAKRLSRSARDQRGQQQRTRSPPPTRAPGPAGVITAASGSGQAVTIRIVKQYRRVNNKRSTLPDKFWCKYCGAGFPRIYALNRHENTHEGKFKGKSYKSKRGNYTCPYCSSVFSFSTNLLKHIKETHVVSPQQTIRTSNEMKTINPLNHNSALKNRGEDPLDPHNEQCEVEVKNLLEWVKEFAAGQQRRIDLKPTSVYLAASLGPNFDPKIHKPFEFVRSGDEGIRFYIGFNSKTIGLNDHHLRFPDISPLGKADKAGETCVLLKIWEFKVGSHVEKVSVARALEASLMEFALTSQEFKSRDGKECKFYNQQRELGAFFKYCSKEQQKTSLEKAVKGVSFICCQEDCQGGCEAIAHLKSDECSPINFPLKEKIVVRPLNIGSASKKSSKTKVDKKKKNPLVTPAEIKVEVDRRLKDLQERRRQDPDHEHHVYITILARKQDFPGLCTARDVCRAINNGGHAQAVILYYVGKGERDGMNYYHKHRADISAVAKKASGGDYWVIQIATFKCSSLEEAEKLEAKLLMCCLLQARKKMTGTNFNPINEAMPWSAFNKLTEEEKLQSVRMGVAGVSPITLQGVVPHFTMGKISFPVNLGYAIKKNKILDVTSIAPSED
ncbi:uncharacterized protein LOC118434813 isoform X1 [Folsomia candida]|uniref:uncharacterized protein LOC118434813 isoform X1 n=1 Tax=Folsomia candida TaxID=158441 RepID=UPI001604C169|nr:uncharacterized protein LOC118434813 isoform X1 [Folsomia candida]